MLPVNAFGWPPQSLLGKLGRRTQEALLGLGTAVTFDTHQRIVRQGDTARHTLLMLKGLVKVVVDTERGRDVVIAIRGPGDLVGEMAALEGRARSAHVVACAPVVARIIHSPDFGDFLERNSDAYLALARVLSERLRGADRRSIDFIACPAPVRVARTLADVVQRWGGPTNDGPGLVIPLSQAEIASLAGTGLSTVEKACRQLAQAGALDRRYRGVLVTDVCRLRRFGELPDEIPY